MFAADSLLDLGCTPAELQSCEVPDTDTVVMVFTDAAYTHFTCNLLTSIRWNAPEMLESVLVCCLDDKARGVIQASNDDIHTCLCLGMLDAAEDPALYRSARFNKIVSIKVMLIQQLLNRGKQVLYCDSDIVILRNPMPHILSHSTPVVIQAEQTDPLRLCTGFIFVRPNQETIQVFDWTRIPPLCISEQPVVNYLLKDLGVPYTPLDSTQFPQARCGMHPFQLPIAPLVNQHQASTPPLCITIGLVMMIKLGKMKNYSHWFTDIEEMEGKLQANLLRTAISGKGQECTTSW